MPNAVYLTQAEAARRLLNAGIRMFFREDDILAVHNIAHSALQIIIDLINARGTTDDLCITGISRGLFEAVRAAAEERTHPLLENTEMQSLVAKLPMELIERVKAGARYEDLDLLLTVSKSFPQRFWAEQRLSWNQLKHAQRSEMIAVGADTHNTEDILAFAMGGFVLLGFPMRDSTMRTFHLFRCAGFPDDPDYEDVQRERVTFLRSKNISDRKKACRLIVSLTQ